MKKKALLSTLAAAALGAFATQASAVPAYADVVFIVDESGSMSGEHAWLGGMVDDLDAGLIARGVGAGGTNQYGLTGFGASSSHGLLGHEHVVGGSEFGTWGQFQTATGGLVISGGTEDGWNGLRFATSNYAFRAGSARNFILVTDEDRDNADGSASTYANTAAAIQAAGGILNVVVNNAFRCGDGSVALGIDSEGTGYKADGAGGYTTCSNAYALNGSDGTFEQYVTMAMDLDGAAWDLNQLRAGGNTALSFTQAFVDIKVQEIVTRPVPAPATLPLAAMGLLGLFAIRRRRSAKA